LRIGLRENRLSTAAALCDQSGMAKAETNAAAVALGRLGGLKGGKARAKKLTVEKLPEAGGGHQSTQSKLRVDS
jgi:hypothetical protein